MWELVIVGRRRIDGHGERILRTLVRDVRAVLFNEPLSNLDVRLRVDRLVR